MLAATSICFDLSVFELFVPLSWRRHGDPRRERPGAARAARAGGEVTLVNTVPSAMAELARAARCRPAVRTVNLAGEPLPRAAGRAHLRRRQVARLCNLYGPSEDTTYSTGAAVERDARAGRRSAGRVAGTRAYVLDRRLRAGARSASPASCYLGRRRPGPRLSRPPGPDRRALRARPLRRGAGERLYRTGDLGPLLRRRRARVPGPRSTTRSRSAASASSWERSRRRCARMPGVREAVVVVREDAPATAAGRPTWSATAGGGSRRRAARAPARAAAGLHGARRRSCALAALPLTPNGKVDRKALPAPGAAARRPRRPTRRRGRDSRRRSPRSGARSWACRGSAPRTTSSTWAATRCCSPGAGAAAGPAGTGGQPGGAPDPHHGPRPGAPPGARPRGARRSPPLAARRRDARDPGGGRRSRSPSSASPAASPAPPASRRSGPTCAPASASIARFSDEELAAAGVAPELRRDPRYVPAARGARRGRAVRRRLLRLQPARGRAAGPAAAPVPRMRLGGPGGRRLRLRCACRGRSACSPASGSTPTCQQILASLDLDDGARSSCAARQRQGLPGHPRLLQAEPQGARAWRSRRPAPPRWWRSTWPARTCFSAPATWRWPAASPSPCRSAPAISTRRGASSRPTAAAAPSTPRRAARCRRAASGSWCSSGWQDALADGDTIHAVILGSAVNNDGVRARRATPRRASPGRRR